MDVFCVDDVLIGLLVLLVMVCCLISKLLRINNNLGPFAKQKVFKELK